MIERFSKTYRLAGILKSCNAYKAKGYPAVSLFLHLLGVVFTNRSMYMNFLTGKHTEAFGKTPVESL
ncbi:hypothetical protein [Anaerotalea alkaliphila]|uniref:hypothetical protein n=1 Tax=Anaerotalea alkaliphila TaxID=2662126 RepID=UPI001FE7C5E1|nr:hypothetical protein [Anaerotalea alkaliphila]